MKTIAMIAAGVLAASAPAFAQEAGAPGAVGVTGPLTGANPGSGYAYDNYNGPYGGYGSDGSGWNYRNGNNPYNTSPGVILGPMVEGRAVAPDEDYDGPPPGGFYRGPDYPRYDGPPARPW